MLFANPAVKVLEDRLWGAARKRYLQDHPNDCNADAQSIMRKARTAYKESVAASVKEADHKIKAIWDEFRHGMMQHVRASLGVVFRMSEVDWYAEEFGQPASPEVIAVPCELLKYMTASLLFRSLRREIDFEDLDDETLEALSTYAVDQKLEEVLERARRHYEPFEIGEQRTCFVLAEVLPGDAYYLGEEKHHSKIDMAILASTAGSSPDKKKAKMAVKNWLHHDRKNRKNDRRFAGEGWEIDFEQLKSWGKL